MNERTSFVDKIFSMGEEAQGQLLGKLLSSERLVSLMNIALDSGEVARAAVESGLLGLFKALNVPSLDDVHELERKLDELEELLGEITTLVAQQAAEQGDAKKAAAQTSSAKKRRSRRRD